MFYIEGNLSPTDCSGQLGPMGSNRSMAIRHNARGYAKMVHLHTEKMDKITFDDASGTKRFWLPKGDVDEGQRSFFNNLR